MNVPRGPPMVPSPPNSLPHQCHQRQHSPVFEVIYPDSSPPRNSMAIPGTTTYSVPPPLPPPRYIQDLDAGVDISWALQNEGSVGGKDAFIPVKPGSSLLGCLLRDQSVKAEDGDIDMDWDSPDVFCRKKIHAQVSQYHLAVRTAHPYLPLSRDPHAASSPRLQGEQPLSQKNHNQFTDAYDKHMLLKIGKSTSSFPNSSSIQNTQMSSPPRLHTPGRETRELQDLAQAPPANTRNMPPLPSPIVSTKDSWSSHRANTIPYSPVADTVSSLSNSLNVPHSDLGHVQERGSWSSQIQRRIESQHDVLRHSNDAERNTERTLDTSRNLTAEGETFRPALRLGTKRRALSPASETVFQEDRRSSQACSQSAESSTDPFEAGRQPQRTGSLSSVASSAFPHSSASSYLLSATSSLTSASTLDFASLRSPADFAAPDLPVRVSTYTPDAVIPARKLSDTSSATDNAHKLLSNAARPTVSRIGPSFICSCCPKKPKRFENEKQLRQHENEKQYACAFCTNRFKNKNEAERHQNSLHLRKQSWSCVAMTAYETAFQPSTDGEQHDPYHDICGFCGTEFSNQPKDWNVRIDHLREVHKFGECNATKKFYRADHFRQHLKHSHAGKSGKWTNTLENSCQREEAISELSGLSPSASDLPSSFGTGHVQSKSTNPSESGMSNSGVDIADELHEGSYANAG